MLETGCDNYKEEKDIKMCHKKEEMEENSDPGMKNTTLLFCSFCKSGTSSTKLDFSSSNFNICSALMKQKSKRNLPPLLHDYKIRNITYVYFLITVSV